MAPQGINSGEKPSEGTTVHATDDGGAVENAEQKRAWYVVLVAPRSEKSVCKSLQQEGYEAYAATRNEIHVWSRGQRKKVEQVVIHGVVFVKITTAQTNEIRTFPKVYSYMMDPAKRGNKLGLKTFAIIPDAEMRILKAMLGQEEYDVAFSSSDFTVGEYVRVLGFDTGDHLAQIIRLPDDKKSYVGIRVSFLGCAYMQVPAARILKISPRA